MAFKLFQIRSIEAGLAQRSGLWWHGWSSSAEHARRSIDDRQSVNYCQKCFADDLRERHISSALDVFFFRCISRVRSHGLGICFYADDSVRSTEVRSSFYAGIHMFYGKFFNLAGALGVSQTSALAKPCFVFSCIRDVNAWHALGIVDVQVLLVDDRFLCCAS